MSRARKPIAVTPYVAALAARATEYINRNIHRCLTLDDVAAHVGEDKFQLHRFFSAATGVTLKNAITARQIEVAKANMLAGLTFAKVARASGFSSHRHFGERFKQYTGKAPLDWLRAEAARRSASASALLPADWPEWCTVTQLAARWGLRRSTINWFHHADGLGLMRDGRIMIHRDEVTAAEGRSATFAKFRYIHRGKQ